MLIDDPAPAVDSNPALSDYDLTKEPRLDNGAFEAFLPKRPVPSSLMEDARRNLDARHAELADLERQKNERLEIERIEAQRAAQAAAAYDEPRADRHEDGVHYNLSDMPEGPYYDPRDRHRAVDPWDLLDDPYEQQSFFPEETGPYRRADENVRAPSPAPYSVGGRAPNDQRVPISQQRRQQEYSNSAGQRPPRPQQPAQPRQLSALAQDQYARGGHPGGQPGGYYNTGRAIDFRTQAAPRQDDEYARPSINFRPRDDYAPQPQGGYSNGAGYHGEYRRDAYREDYPQPAGYDAAARPANWQRDGSYERDERPARPADRPESDWQRGEIPQKREYWPPDEPPRPAVPEAPRNERAADRGEAKKPRRIRLGSWFFWLLIAALMGLILFFIGSSLVDKYGSIDDAFRAIFVERNSKQQRKPSEVEVDALNDQPAHVLSVYGFEGETVSYPDIGKQYKITGGVSRVIMLDQVWIPEEADPALEQIEIKPLAVIIDGEGNQTPIDMPSFTIDVPQASLTIDQPAAASLTVDSAEIEIIGTVSVNVETDVFVNDVDISNYVNDQGIFRYTYVLPDYGSHVITVRAQARKHRPNEVTINATYPKTSVELTIDPDVPLRTDKSTLAITGSFEAGAELTISGDGIDGDPVIDKALGTFKFTAKLAKNGRNNYKFALNDGSVTTDRELSIIRMPSLDDYTAKALAFDYKTISGNTSKHAGKIFLFEGTISEILEGFEDTTTMMIEVGKDRFVKVEYFGTTEVRESDSYKVYATLIGTDEEREVPKLDAFFLIKK